MRCYQATLVNVVTLVSILRGDSCLCYRQTRGYALLRPNIRFSENFLQSTSSGNFSLSELKVL